MLPLTFIAPQHLSIMVSFDSSIDLIWIREASWLLFRVQSNSKGANNENSISTIESEMRTAKKKVAFGEIADLKSEDLEEAGLID